MSTDNVIRCEVCGDEGDVYTHEQFGTHDVCGVCGNALNEILDALFRDPEAIAELRKIAADIQATYTRREPVR